MHCSMRSLSIVSSIRSVSSPAEVVVQVTAGLALETAVSEGGRRHRVER
jgi:hypothetical protein